MKFKKHILLFSIIISFCFAFLGTASILPKNFVFAEEVQETDTDQSEEVQTPPTTINNLTDITSGEEGSIKSYKLEDKDFEISKSLDDINYVTLNGNGATIKITTAISLFESLSNVTICNLNIVLGSTEFSVSNSTSYGVLAKTITNSNVYAINFKNVEMILNGENSQSVSTVNVGLLAGQIIGSNINQIKIDECSIETKSDCSIKTNSNIGLLAGKISDGTRLQNNIITNSSLNISVTDTDSKNFNFGGLVGDVSSAFKITNNILDFSSAKSTIELTSKYYNFGYLVGKTETNHVSFFNNVVLIAETSPASNNTETFVGSIIGFMNNTLPSESIYGFYSSKLLNYIGNYTYDNATNTFGCLGVLSKNEIYTKIEDKTGTGWKLTDLWDFDNIWIKANSVLPNLQFFETYSISFSSEESIKNLGIDNLPPLNIVTVNINNQDTTNNQLNNINYSDTVTLKVNIETNYKPVTEEREIDFSKFFKITGLYLNGTRVYHFEDANTTSTDSNKNISHKEEGGSVTFTISDFTAKDSGVYSVELTPIEYKLKIKVFDDSSESNTNTKPIAQIKSTEGSKPLGNDDILLKYGHYYSYETYQVNTDYSKEADWYVFNKPSAEGGQTPENVFNPENNTANINGKNKISWVFNENWELLDINNPNTSSKASGDKPSGTSDNISYFKLGDSEFQIYVVFSRDVVNLKIEFKLGSTDGKTITEQIAKLKIDADNSTIKFNKETGTYSIKKKYGNHTILLEELSTAYEFTGWYQETGMSLNVDENGTFKIDKNEGDSTFVVYAVFDKIAEEQQANLLWLWITLGGVALVAVAVVVIVIIKKKNSGGSSYRKYMY